MTRPAWIAGLAVSLLPLQAAAQDTFIEIGKNEYMVACAGCHGESGKGTGRLAEFLTIEAPDLTTIRKRMQVPEGEFPYSNTLKLIDGRDGIRAHGGAMPVWGDRYSSRGMLNWWRDASEETRQLAALGRMLALVHYIESIQE